MNVEIWLRDRGHEPLSGNYHLKNPIKPVKNPESFEEFTKYEESSQHLLNMVPYFIMFVKNPQNISFVKKPRKLVKNPRKLAKNPESFEEFTKYEESSQHLLNMVPYFIMFVKNPQKYFVCEETRKACEESKKACEDSRKL